MAMPVVSLIFCELALLISELLAGRPEASIFDKFQQSDFKLKFERIELVSYDKSAIKHFEVVTFKYNRSTPVVKGKIEFNADIGNDLEIISQAYKFMSNEYRLFPIRAQVNACFAISKNLLGVGRMFSCGKEFCPVLKRKIVRICNWTVDEGKYPPFIPNGKYMLEHQAVYRSKEVALLRGYAEVTRPIVMTD